MIAAVFVVLLLVYLGVNITLVLLRNQRAHKFFKTKAPNLPVLPNANIFSGHYFETIKPDKNWKIISNLHDRYGPTFGFYMCDQPWVATKDLDILKLIEVDRAHKHLNRSKFGLPFKEFNNSIFQVDDEDWRRVRRAISPALTNHKVRSDEVSADIKAIIMQLEESLRRKLDRAEAETGEKSILLNVDDVSHRFALAVIFLITYKRDNIIDFDSQLDQWVEAIKRGARNINNPVVSLSMMFPFLRPFCNFLVQFHEVGKLQVKIIDYIAEATDINRVAREQHARIQRRISLATGAKEREFSHLIRQGNFKRRLVDTIIDAFIEKKIGYDDFIGSTLFLLLAGFETTADTISCLIWQLAHHPDIQEELRSCITEQGIDADYVIWCIMETVRWHPAVPLGTGRILSEDIKVNGTFLPKGSFVQPSTHSIHHDSSIWPDADQFRPDRWRHSSDFHPAAFMGFGLGPRNCIGGKLAIHEIKMVMQMLLSKYRIEKCAQTSESYDFSSPGLVYTILDQPIVVRLVTLQ